MNKRVFIIAEAGVNHNGKIALAKEMITAARKTGADCVKFQTFNTESIVSKYAKKSEYQKRNTDITESQYEMLKKLELAPEVFGELLSCCKEQGIIFLSSPFDLSSIDVLSDLGLELFKIPSGEIDNLLYLRKIGKLEKKVILSTGTTDLCEIEEALKVLVQSGTQKNDITVLHCNTEYPSPFPDINLRAMLTIRDAFEIEVGYSDHTAGIEIPVAAAALGASVIEKHFTLDKNMEGPDHQASLNPEEFKNMVTAIRHVEEALGDGIKKPSASELANKKIIRKSIRALREIREGEAFTEVNLTIKRPAEGISPMRWDEVLGKKAIRDFNEDELIEL